MIFIQRREKSEKAEKYGLMSPFKTLKRIDARTIEIRSEEDLKEWLKEKFGSGDFMIVRYGGNPPLEIIWKGHVHSLL